VDESLLYARALHFAATIMVGGVVFFIVFIGDPVFRSTKNSPRLIAAVRLRCAWIAWVSLLACVVSGAAWLVVTAASMSGQPVTQVFSGGVLATVLLHTDFGNDWLVRFALACCLAATFVRVFSMKPARPGWIAAAAVILAAALVGALAGAGHAIGGQGVEGIIHPAADVLHLMAAAAWLGALIPLVLVLKQAGHDADTLALARSTTERFSTLGIALVATILVTGIVNTWYLVGSTSALVDTDYGRLLTAKIVLFFVMVAIAAVNRLRLTPRLLSDGSLVGAQQALRQLRANAAIETAAGAIIIAIVAVLGTMPPASHAHHHEASNAIPADAFFQHIHTEHGMADVTIEPGHVGIASVTMRLWDADENPLEAQAVTLTLTPPAPAGKPITRTASLNPDGLWQVDGLVLPRPGIWTVTVSAVLGQGKHIDLAAPVVIDAR
jgi:copper resistance protein D